ncbi:PolC-type DNA polymerase III [Planctomycetota bacterium]
MNFSVLDVETTGLSYRNGDRICEVGVVRVRDGTPVASFQALVDPGIPMPAMASSVNGITDGMVADAPLFSEIAEEFRRFVGDDVLAIYNAPFDIGFIRNELADAHCPPLENRILDVLPLARRMLDLERYSLLNVVHYLEISESQEHRALGDCLITAEVLMRFVYMAEKRGDNIGL